MRILHTNFHRGWGGQSNRILIVCRGLAAKGHDVALAVPRGSVLAERARAAGIGVFDDVRFARGLRLRSLIHDIRALRALAAERRFDIVHTHGSQDSWAAALALRTMTPRPIVLRTKHNIFPIRDHGFNRWLYGRATDGIVCISRAILEYCAAKPYLRRENLALIHSAVDFERYGATQDRSLRQELGVGDRFVAGIVGRLREEKGHRYLFDALPEVVRQAPDFTLLVVGSGSLEDEFRKQVQALGVERHVVFAGFREDVPRVLAALDLFVAPSISEGLGTAILEAAAAGLPIVATNVGGIPDTVRDGETGLLVPPADPAALAQALLRMYRDRPLAQRLGAAAAAHVRAEFSESTLVDKNDALYRQWLKRRPGGSLVVVLD
ncbi:MAG: glycosyltransferase family 4 protein [Candidatus Sumerlaeota bacterium]|nr:glycosyltransferase family 4 protein [Candidatus Sumerlaeota bacterium]